MPVDHVIYLFVQFISSQQVLKIWDRSYLTSFRNGKELETPEERVQRNWETFLRLRGDSGCAPIVGVAMGICLENLYTSSTHGHSGSPRSLQLRKNETDTDRWLHLSKRRCICMMATKGTADLLSFLLSTICLAFRKHVCYQVLFFHFSWLECQWLIDVPFPLMLLIENSNIYNINYVLSSYSVPGTRLSTLLDPIR